MIDQPILAPQQLHPDGYQDNANPRSPSNLQKPEKPSIRFDVTAYTIYHGNYDRRGTRDCCKVELTVPSGLSD